MPRSLQPHPGIMGRRHNNFYSSSHSTTTATNTMQGGEGIWRGGVGMGATDPAMHPEFMD
eukprot:6743751-Pyramimonas_sp.AAC.1